MDWPGLAGLSLSAAAAGVAWGRRCRASLSDLQCRSEARPGAAAPVGSRLAGRRRTVGPTVTVTVPVPPPRRRSPSPPESDSESQAQCGEPEV